jgi:lipoyl(octanoyl) transferase
VNGATGARRETRWSWLGRVGYEPAAALQRRVRDALARGDGPERLLLLEHDPVYTLGRNAVASDVLLGPAELAARGVAVAESDRGGQVTYHGPGQLVGYPILDLNPDRRDVRRYVRDLSAAIVATLAELGVEASAGEGERIGVWVGPRKIASIGVHLARWRTTHGFALNVDPDLGHFGGIVACGLPSAATTSVARELGAAPGLEEVARRFVPRFAEVFGRTPVADAGLAAAEGLGGAPRPAAASGGRA